MIPIGWPSLGFLWLDLMLPVRLDCQLASQPTNQSQVWPSWPIRSWDFQASSSSACVFTLCAWSRVIPSSHPTLHHHQLWAMKQLDVFRARGSWSLIRKLFSFITFIKFPNLQPQPSHEQFFHTTAIVAMKLTSGNFASKVLV